MLKAALTVLLATLGAFIASRLPFAQQTQPSSRPESKPFYDEDLRIWSWHEMVIPDKERHIVEIPVNIDFAAASRPDSADKRRRILLTDLQIVGSHIEKAVLMEGHKTRWVLFSSDEPAPIFQRATGDATHLATPLLIASGSSLKIRVIYSGSPLIYLNLIGRVVTP